MIGIGDQGGSDIPARDRRSIDRERQCRSMRTAVAIMLHLTVVGVRGIIIGARMAMNFMGASVFGRGGRVPDIESSLNDPK